MLKLQLNHELLKILNLKVKTSDFVDILSSFMKYFTLFDISYQFLLEIVHTT